jgi:hypothetical protein
MENKENNEDKKSITCNNFLLPQTTKVQKNIHQDNK